MPFGHHLLGLVDELFSGDVRGWIGMNEIRIVHESKRSQVYRKLPNDSPVRVSKASITHSLDDDRTDGKPSCRARSISLEDTLSGNKRDVPPIFPSGSAKGSPNIMIHGLNGIDHRL